MALQGFISTPAGDFDKAYLKVIKASILAEDSEIVVPTESDVETVGYRTIHKGQAVGMAWSDELAYKNRAVPVHAFYVNFDVPELDCNLLELAYKAMREGDPDHEYLPI